MANILIVDDVKDVRSLLSDVVRSIGCQPYTASTGQEMIDLITENPSKFEVALIDINMPVMNGLIASQLAKNIAPEMKMFFVSARNDQEMVLHAMNAGGIDYVVKPIDISIMIHKLNSVVNSLSKEEFATIEADVNVELPDFPIDIEINLTKLSELGLELKTDLPLKPGSKINIKIPKLIKEIGVTSPLLVKVIECTKVKNGRLYRCICEFTGLHERETEKIRSITQKGKFISDKIIA